MNRFKGSKILISTPIIPYYLFFGTIRILLDYVFIESELPASDRSTYPEKKAKKLLQTERRMKRRTDTPFYRTLLDDYFCRLRRLNIAFNNKFYGMLNLKNIFRNVDFTKVYWIQIYRLIESKVVSIISLHQTKIFPRMAK